MSFAPPKFDPPAPQPAGLQLMESINYVMRNPNWVTNLAMGSLCIALGMIPAIGVLAQLVLFGYALEVGASLTASGGRQYADFDLNRFGAYLTRALPAMVLGLLVLPILAIVMILVMPIMLLAGAGGENGGGIAIVSLLLMFGVFFLVIVGINLILAPLVFRGGVSYSFGEAFRFGWAIDFVLKCWPEMLMAAIFQFAALVVLGLLGAVALCVGTLPAAVFGQLMQMHLMWQLHQIHISRGGEPIPVAFGPPSSPSSFGPGPGGYRPPPGGMPPKPPGF